MNTEKTNYDVWTITPEKAIAFLDGHENYRNITQKRVDAYAEEMRAGRWVLGDPIMFDADGKLINGQHRLRAVIAAGLSVRFIVLTGMPNESVLALDDGGKRSNRQKLRNKFPDTTKDAAAVLNYFLYMPASNNPPLLASQLITAYEKYMDVINQACQWFCSKRRGISKGAVVAAFARALYAYPEKKQLLERLAKSLYTYDFSECMNGGTLAKWINSTPSVSGGNYRVKEYLKTARAIQAEIEGVKITALYAPTTDPFPLDRKDCA